MGGGGDESERGRGKREYEEEIERAREKGGPKTLRCAKNSHSFLVAVNVIFCNTDHTVDHSPVVP